MPDGVVAPHHLLYHWCSNHRLWLRRHIEHRRAGDRVGRATTCKVCPAGVFTAKGMPGPMPGGTVTCICCILVAELDGT